MRGEGQGDHKGGPYGEWGYRRERFALMKMEAGLREGRFRKRLNRFAARVEVEGNERLAHVPNSGRLRELFVPGATVYVSPATTPGRKTAFDLRLVSIDGTLVSCDARLPPSLVAEAQEHGKLPEFEGYPKVEREVTVEESRLDLRFSGEKGQVYVETKSVTLVCDGRALFPDAPTTRGTKHVRTLMKICERGNRAAVVFVVQRDDANCLSPKRDSDPEFASALERAAGMGVEVYAYGCRVTTEEITLGGRVPVEFL